MSNKKTERTPAQIAWDKLSEEDKAAIKAFKVFDPEFISIGEWVNPKFKKLEKEIKNILQTINTTI